VGHAKEFFAFGHTKNGKEQKGGRSGVGEGSEGNKHFKSVLFFLGQQKDNLLDRTKAVVML